jgi:hypothetical protein
MGRAEIAWLLRQNYPAMAAADIDRYSREIVRSARDFESLFSFRSRPFVSTIAWNGLRIGGVMAALGGAAEALGQYRETGRLDWRRIGLSGGITLVGTASGPGSGQGAIVLVTKNPIAYQFTQRTSSLLGLGSTSLTRNVLGGMIGGGVATVFLAYGGYFAGFYDLETAHRHVVAGGTGAIAGTAFGLVIFRLAATLGTASTGAAIGTLGGAAATHSTLAWLGGSSLAAGGFGMTGGLVVLTGGAA